MNRTAPLIVLVLTLFVRNATGICVLLSAQDLMRQQNTVMFFKGKVLAVRSTHAGEIVTFAVDQVWKGNVRRNQVLINQRIGVETVGVVVRNSYFVSTYQTPTKDRDTEDVPVNATNGCSFWQTAPQGLGSIPGHLPSRVASQ